VLFRVKYFPFDLPADAEEAKMVFSLSPSLISTVLSLAEGNSLDSRKPLFYF
jgi:hypothetical protein